MRPGGFNVRRHGLFDGERMPEVRRKHGLAATIRSSQLRWLPLHPD